MIEGSASGGEHKEGYDHNWNQKVSQRARIHQSLNNTTLFPMSELMLQNSIMCLLHLLAQNDLNWSDVSVNLSWKYDPEENIKSMYLH